MSAGIASLDLLAAPGFYESLEARAKRLGDGIVAALGETGAPATAVRAGSLLTLFFSREPVTDYAGAKKCDHAAALPNSSAPCSIAAFFLPLLNLKPYSSQRLTRMRTSTAR